MGRLVGSVWLVKPVAEIALPTTIQAVLAARVDRLEERQKQVLRDAAVIGRQFTEPILRRVVELPEANLAQALDKLAAAEFIFEQALSPGRSPRAERIEMRRWKSDLPIEAGYCRFGILPEATCLRFVVNSFVSAAWRRALRTVRRLH